MNKSKNVFLGNFIVRMLTFFNRSPRGRFWKFHIFPHYKNCLLPLFCIPSVHPVILLKLIIKKFRVCNIGLLCRPIITFFYLTSQLYFVEISYVRHSCCFAKILLKKLLFYFFRMDLTIQMIRKMHKKIT